MYTLINSIIICVLLGIGFAINSQALLIIYALGVMIPGFAVTIRRLHDTNRSGWYILCGFIPAIGGLIILYFAVADSQPGDNQFGPNPKLTQAEVEVAG